jgi:hypothetical protein
MESKQKEEELEKVERDIERLWGSRADLEIERGGS